MTKRSRIVKLSYVVRCEIVVPVSDTNPYSGEFDAVQEAIRNMGTPTGLIVNSMQFEVLEGNG